MDPSNFRILVVDDEPDIVELLEYHLKKEGYHVKTASNGEEALKKIRKSEQDLVLLDIMMPVMNGIDCCKEIRKDSKFSQTIVAFLTARNEDFTEISALDSGGDDFISKPIKLNLLKSRVKALLRRRVVEQTASVQSFGDLELNHEEICIRLSGGDAIQLAKKEYELLVLLTSKPGKVFKRHKIMDKVWGNEVIVGDRTIDVHIRKLREKIGQDYFKTVKGIGYKFEVA